MYRIARVVLSRGNGLNAASPLGAVPSLSAASSQRHFNVSAPQGAKDLRYVLGAKFRALFYIEISRAKLS